MNDKKVIAELRRSYNKLERQFIRLRKENDRLHEQLKETKRPAKSVQDTNLKPQNVCKSTVCE